MYPSPPDITSRERGLWSAAAVVMVVPLPDGAAWAAALSPPDPVNTGGASVTTHGETNTLHADTLHIHGLRKAEELKTLWDYTRKRMRTQT